MLQSPIAMPPLDGAPPVPPGAGDLCVDGVELKPSHHKRLRFIFEKGRPIHIAKLEGVDVVLVAAGLVRHEAEPSGGGAHLTLDLTESGRALVMARAAARRNAVAIHNSLASRLAHWLRSTRGCMTWEDATFARPVSQARDASLHWTTVRIDVFACAYTPTARIAKCETFEVKRSMSDFLSELKKPEKLMASRELAEASWFVTPAGMLDPAVVPEGFGLMVEASPGVFEVVKRPKRKKAFMPAPETLMALVYRRATLPDSALY